MRAGMRGILLFLLPLPLLLKAVVSLWAGDIRATLASGVPYAVLLLGALIAREGLVRETRYLERPLALAPPPPLKAIAAILLGVGTALAAYVIAGHDPLIAALFGGGAFAGTLLYYGTDPRRLAVASGDHGIGIDELGTALKQAYAKLDGINEARKAIASREFQERLSEIVGHSEAILKLIEEDPRDLGRARKFLHVYLDGVLAVTRQYAQTHAKTQSAVLEQNFRALLIDMETVCKEQREKLLQNDLLDLDVQIEVLSTRLKREGVL
jgi:hypothetical protein